jgi:hypothetical protein
VHEIDVQAAIPTRGASPISLRVTEPSQVERIIGWFDTLEPPSRNGPLCAMILRPRNMIFRFRAANGKELATMTSTAAGASYCDPFFLTIGARHVPLVDRNGARPFLSNVEQLLGIHFR